MSTHLSNLEIEASPSSKYGMPVLLQSSEELGWGDLVARIYDEPQSMELWRPPPSSVLTIGLVTSSVMNLEQRNDYAPWRGQNVHPRQFFLQSYHEPYELRWQSGGATTIQTVMLKLHQQALFRIIEEVTERDPAQITFVEQIGFDDPLLLQLGFALRQELEQPTAIGPLYAQTAAQMLAVHVLRHYSTYNPQIWEPWRGLNSKQVQRIHDFVQDHLAQNLTLAHLAQQLDLSPYHFARMFRQATGESPHQFVLSQRLERAKWLLKMTPLPIASIAFDCGFASQSYLTTAFKRRYGNTPHTYRRQT